MKRKLTPELRDRIRRHKEEGELATQRLQQAMDRAEAWLHAREEARLRRERSLFRRLNPFRRAA